MISLKKTHLAIRLIFFYFGLLLSTWAVMIPYIKDSLNLNDADLGLFLLTMGIGAIVTMPFSGWLINHFGTKKMIICSSISLIPILPILAWISSPFSLGLLLPLFGALSSCMNVSMNSHAAAVQAKFDKPINSGIHAIFSVGGLTGALIMGLLLQMGWSVIESTCMIAMLLALIILTQWHYLLPLENDIKAEKAHGFSIPEGKIWLLGLLCFLVFLAEGSMMDWSAVLLNTEFAYKTSLAGIGYALFSVAMAFGRMTGDFFIKKIGSVLVMRLGSFLTAFGFIVATQAFGGYFELLGFVLIGLGTSNLVPLIFSAAGKFSSVSASTALAVVTTMGYLGLLIGPTLIGFVAETTSLSIALCGVAPLLIVVGLSSKIAMQFHVRVTT